MASSRVKGQHTPTNLTGLIKRKLDMEDVEEGQNDKILLLTDKPHEEIEKDVATEGGGDVKDGEDASLEKDLKRQKKKLDNTFDTNLATSVGSLREYRRA